MANQYKSKQYNDNVRFRPDSANEAEEVSLTIQLPQGTVLANGDTLAFGILGENVIVQSYELDMGAIDTNAAATLAGRLGVVTYAGAGQTQTWTGSNDAIIIAAATVLQTNTTGYKSFSGLNSDVSTGGGFAVKPYGDATTHAPFSTQQVLVLNISAGAATNNLANGAQNVTLYVKYQYAYPNQFVTSVTGVSPANLLGTKVTSPAVTYQYGPLNSPNAP